MYRSADNSHVKEIKQIQKNLSIIHIRILMVLITSLFVVELYFLFMNFREGAADIAFRLIWSLKIVRMRRANRSRFVKMTKNSHSILIEMKISFLHVIALYPMNTNHTATNLKLSSFHPQTQNSSVTNCCVSFFVQYIYFRQ